MVSKKLLVLSAMFVSAAVYAQSLVRLVVFRALLRSMTAPAC